MYKLSHVIVCCTVLHVTDTEPSVHVCWSDTASQTALQLALKDGSVSALLHIVTPTCARCTVLHVTDTEPSMHVCWSDTASQTALQLPLKNGSVSALMHIVTDGTR
jgi:hypothetical protein